MPVRRVAPAPAGASPRLSPSAMGETYSALGRCGLHLAIHSSIGRRLSGATSPPPSGIYRQFGGEVFLEMAVLPTSHARFARSGAAASEILAKAERLHGLAPDGSWQSFCSSEMANVSKRPLAPRSIAPPGQHDATSTAVDRAGRQSTIRQCDRLGDVVVAAYRGDAPGDWSHRCQPVRSDGR